MKINTVPGMNQCFFAQRSNANSQNNNKTNEFGFLNVQNAELQKSKAARYEFIHNKMLAGRRLTFQEMRFLKEHFPDLAAVAEQVEKEIEGLRDKMKSCISKEECDQVVLKRKMELIGENKDNNLCLYVIPAINNAF